MEKLELQYFKNKLLEEKKRVNSLLDKMEKNEVINSNSEMSTELSFYDNHPSDAATELNDKEKGVALKGNEMSIMKKIDEALNNIEDCSYGKCKKCGVNISRERLEFIPYAQYCVNCQNEINEIKPRSINDRPVEEKVLRSSFGYGHKEYTKNVGFDAEDSYQSVERFNRLENIYEYDENDEDDYVEPIEKISNAQYKSQLPD